MRVEGEACPPGRNSALDRSACWRYGPLEPAIFVQVEPARDLKALVAAAKVPRLHLRPECFVDLFQHIAVPCGSHDVAHVPKAQVDVQVGPRHEGDAAKVEYIL